MPDGYTIDPYTGEMVPASSVPSIPMPTPTPTPGTSLPGVNGQGAPSNMFRGGGYGGGQSSINAANLPSPGDQSLAARFLRGFGAKPATPMRGPAPSFPMPNPNDQTAPLSPNGLPIIAGPGANPNVSPSGDVPYTGPGAGAPSNGFGMGSAAPITQANPLSPNGLPIIAGPGANQVFQPPALPSTFKGTGYPLPPPRPSSPNVPYPPPRPWYDYNPPARYDRDPTAPRPYVGGGQTAPVPYSPNMSDAMLGDQVMGGNLFPNQPARAPAVQGPLAAFAQQPSSPFTMILRPNAPANTGGRGGGGTPLTTALDLSGYQPAPPPAPPSVNLGYGAPPPVSAPRVPPRSGRAQPFNPLTAVGPHGWRDNPGLGWGASVPRSGGRMSPQGVGVTEFMGP